jgi:hypothetical protein
VQSLAFTVTSSQESVALAGALTPSSGRFNPISEAYESFTFSIYARSHGTSSINLGIPGTEELFIRVYTPPDGTTQISCPTQVSVGDEFHCIIKPMKAGDPVWVEDDGLSLVLGGWPDLKLTYQRQPNGLDLVVTLPAPHNSATLTLTIPEVQVDTVVYVTEVPDATSEVVCPSVVSGWDYADEPPAFKCLLWPRKEGESILATEMDFQLMSESETVDYASRDASVVSINGYLELKAYIKRPFETVTLTELTTGKAFSVRSEPAGFAVGWGITGACPTTSIGDIMLGTNMDFHKLDLGEFKHQRITQVSCNAELCLARTEDARVACWPEGKCTLGSSNGLTITEFTFQNHVEQVSVPTSPNGDNWFAVRTADKTCK